MKNKSDTNLIRHYCKTHGLEIFDVHDMMKKFPDVSPSNFRKYVSRLVGEYLLWPISKGVYFIGNNPTETIIDAAIRDYYFKCTRCAKESFLFSMGIIDERPETPTYYIDWSQGNKKIKGIQFIESKNVFNLMAYRKLDLLDMIYYEDLVHEDDKGKYSLKLAELLLTYKEISSEDEPRIEYPRYVYIKLANLLDSMHISNRVMENYENEVERANRLERNRL